MTRVTPPTSALHVLGQEGKPLGAGKEVVLQDGQAVGLAVGHAGRILLLGEPAALGKQT